MASTPLTILAAASLAFVTPAAFAQGGGGGGGGGGGSGGSAGSASGSAGSASNNAGGQSGAAVTTPNNPRRHWRKRVGWCWPVRFRRRQRVERIADRFAWLGQGVARESLVSRAMADFRRTQPQPKPSGPGKEKAAARTGARGAFPYRNCMLVFRLNPRLRPPNLEAGRGLCVASA